MLFRDYRMMEFGRRKVDGISYPLLFSMLMDKSSKSVRIPKWLNEFYCFILSEHFLNIIKMRVMSLACCACTQIFAYIYVCPPDMIMIHAYDEPQGNSS